MVKKLKRMTSILLCLTMMLSCLNFPAMGVYATDGQEESTLSNTKDNTETETETDTAQPEDDTSQKSSTAATEEATETETGRTSSPRRNAPAEIDTGEDTTWQNDFEYTLDETNHKINVTKFIGDSTVTDVTVLGIARIDGVEYETHITTPYAHVTAPYVFQNCSNILSINFGDGVVIDCSSLDRCFSGCSKLESVVFGDVDSPNVTDMLGMFSGCRNLITVDLSGLDTENVTNMNRMFQHCSSLKNINLSGIDTSNVLVMQEMFSGCSSLIDVNLSSFNTSDLTNTSSMFESCSNLETISFGNNCNFSSITKCDYMYNNCTNLCKLVLPSGFEPSNKDIIPSGYWFKEPFSNGPFSQTTLFSRWNSLGGEEMSGTYYNANCYSAILYESGELVFQYGTIPDEEKGEVNAVYANLYNAYNKHPWEPSSITTVSFRDDILPTNASSWFSGCVNLIDVDCIHLHTNRVTDMSRMFMNCKKLTHLDLSNLVSYSVNDMGYMFSGCEALNTLDISNIKTSNATDMFGIFGCPNLSEIRLSTNFNFSSDGLLPSGDWTKKPYTKGDRIYSPSVLASEWDGTTMAGTFIKLPSSSAILYKTGELVFQRDTISDPEKGEVITIFENYGTNHPWSGRSDITSVSFKDIITPTTMQSWFQGCQNLESINFDNLDTSNVTDMSALFRECPSLTSLDLSSFNTSNVTDMSYMFRGCTSLESVNLSSFDTGKVTGMVQMFLYCRKLQKLNIENFDTRNVTGIHGMFSQCNELSELILGDYFSLNKINGSVHDFYFSIFESCDSLHKIKLPSIFKFTGSDAVNQGSVAPSSANSNILPAGKWLDVSSAGTENEKVYTELELFNQWDGSTMAGTYVRATNIVFNPTGGKVDYTKKEGYLGFTIGDLPTATKKGYTFAGWYTEAKSGEKINPGTLISQDSYYAHWTPISYTIDFDSNGGTGTVASVNVEYDEGYTLISGNLTREGYKLVGWNTRSNGRGYSYSIGDTISKLTSEEGNTITLYAEWEPIGYTITFDSQGGSVIPDRDVQAGNSLGKLYSPAKSGYTFMGWYTDPENGSSISERTVPTGPTTYYAHWQKNPTIIFDTNGGDSNTVTREYKYNAILGQIPVFSKENHVFLGFFTEPDGGTQITRNTRATVDKTYYAHYGKELIFNANGGRITQAATSDGVAAEIPEAFVIESVPTAVKDGYTLDGWYTDPTSGTKVELGDTINLNEGNVLYAHWTPINEKVTLTYNANGGYLSGNNSKTTTEFYKGQPIGGMYSATRGNYKFLGWYTDPDEGTKVSEDEIMNEDRTVYAHWEPSSTVYLYFNKNGGTNVRGNSYQYSTTLNGTRYYYSYSKPIVKGGTIQDIPGAYYKNYILEGWYPNADGTGEKLTKDTIITEPTVYYAKWISNRVEEVGDNLSYIYDVSWTNSSNDTVDNVNNNLNYHPTSSGSLTSTLHIMFELNQAVDQSLPVGAVKIQIPKYIFKDWDGNWIGTNNLSTMLPEYPNTRSGMFFSYIDEGDYYTLVNNTALSGGAGVDFTVSYTLSSPLSVNGGAQDSTGKYLSEYPYYENTLPVIYSIDTDGDNNPDMVMQKDLGIEMHTRVNTSQSKYSGNVYYTWNDSWGKKPADADDYFYVSWSLSNSTSYQTQNFTYEWSEDTVHDGTVAYQSGNTVVMKYPVSLLLEAGTTGKTLYNEATYNETWQSGYKKANRVNASKTVYGPTPNTETGTVGDYPGTTFSKRRSNSLAINGGQEDILDDQKEVNLAYSMTYNGGSRTAPVWDEETQTYTAEKRKIVIQDGNRGDITYSSSDAPEPFIWEPETGNVALGENDYYWKSIYVSLSEYDSKKVGDAWVGNLSNTDTSLYDDIEIWIRTKGSDEYYLYQSFSTTSSTSTITLPTNTTGFKVVHNSDFWYTSMSVNATMALKPTSNIINRVRDDVNNGATSIIKNIGRLEVSDNNGVYATATNRTADTDNAIDYAYELNISNTTLQVSKSSSSATVDGNKGIQEVPMTISAYNYNNSGRVKKFESGIFYDLLPIGTTVDETSISGTYAGSQSGTMEKNYYDVSYISNWEDSGRTMMVITVGMPDNIKANRFTFNYKLTSTYDNVVENGNTVENDVAFANTSLNKTPYINTTGLLETITQKSFYKSLDDTYGGNIGYAKASANYQTISAFSWGYTKFVMTRANYESQDETLPNNEYTYKLTYSQSENGKSDMIAFYDVLEGGTNTNSSEWHGTLVDVNVESIKEALTEGSTTVKCAPVVYYSTKARDSFTSTDYDVTNTSTWTTEKPADASTITAIAVDCSKTTEGTDFILDGQEALSVYITMQAPSDVAYIGKSTANEGISYARKMTQGTLEGDPTPEYADATVTIRDFNVEIEKSSDPGTGTSLLPNRVEFEDDLNYTLAVSNKDADFTVHDISVEDNIPAGLEVDWDNISVYMDNESTAINIENSPRLRMTRNGNKAMFRITELLPNETLHIKIPTMVNTFRARFENTSKITSVNGLNKAISSSTTYHEVKPTPVTIAKYIYGTTDRLSGARLQVKAENGKIVDTWDTTLTEDKVVEVSSGNYTLIELSSPNEYLIAEPMSFIVSKNGTVTVNGETVNKVIMYDRKEFHNYHFEKEWQVEEPEESIVLGMTGSNELTAVEEKGLKAGKTFSITAKKGSSTSSFSATADSNGLITIPAEYSDNTSFSFTAYSDTTQYDFTYTVSKNEPVKPDTLTIHASEEGRNSEGTDTDTIILKKDDGYEGDYKFRSESSDISFVETYPEGWDSPETPSNAVKITFDENFKTYNNNSYLRIYYVLDGKNYILTKGANSGSGTNSRFTNTSLAGKTITVPSKDIYFYFYGGYNPSNSAYGFEVTDISGTTIDTTTGYGVTASRPSASITELTGKSYPATEHGYISYSSGKLWHYDGSSLLSDVGIHAFNITEDGDDYIVHVINSGEKSLAISPSVEATILEIPVDIRKDWISETPIYFNVVSNDRQSTDTVQSIEIMNTAKTTTYEIIQGTDDTGAIVSNQKYDVRNSYIAHVTFKNGTTKDITVNSSPYSPPAITVRFNDTNGVKTVTLNSQNNWHNTVNLMDVTTAPVEVTSGNWDWEYSVESGTGTIVLENTLHNEIPSVTIYTPDVPWIIQTGTNGLPNYIYVIFALSCVPAIYYLTRKRKRQR